MASIFIFTITEGIWSHALKYKTSLATKAKCDGSEPQFFTHPALLMNPLPPSSFLRKKLGKNRCLSINLVASNYTILPSFIHIGPKMIFRILMFYHLIIMLHSSCLMCLISLDLWTPFSTYYLVRMTSWANYSSLKTAILSLCGDHKVTADTNLRIS